MLSHCRRVSQTPIKIRFIACIQIALQGITPLALTLTPAVSFAAPQQETSRVSLPLSQHQRAVIEAEYIRKNHFQIGYILQTGETLLTVAEKYFISLPTLREINRYRFPKDNDFYQASAGQYVMVPKWSSPQEAATAIADCHHQNNTGSSLLTRQSSAATDISTINANNNIQSLQTAPATKPAVWRYSANEHGGVLLPSAENPADDNQQIAQWLSQGGQMAQSGHATDAAKNMALSSASRTVSTNAENWLNQFGHARIQMNLDDRIRMKGSSADLLLPLYDTGGMLTFTQLGIHDKDSYTTANLGMGLRQFNQAQMWGFNTFIDQEIRNNHTRLGLGGEYWRDYLKLAGNGYFGLTGWKESKALDDYEEKPASGFDLRSEGYLPSYPQLGAKLNYEQYFGSDIGLFGKDNRQDNPFAVTAGVNYTPIPLVTAGMDHKQGKRGANDTRFNIQLNYLFGMPWSKQTSPVTVDALRTLNGSRLEFVNRNNDMVMQYRKMETIRLSLPAALSGEVSTQKTVIATVETRHALSRIQWNDASLLAAGGSIRKLDNVQYQITLPDHTGSFPLTATAYDTRGNASNTASTLITVTQASSPETVVTIASLTPDITTAPADGTSTITYTLQATEAARSTSSDLSTYKIRWTNSGAGDLATTESALDTSGKTQVALTSTIAGNIDLTATLVDAAGRQLGQATDNSAGFTNEYNLDDITVDNNSANANGSDTVTLSTRAKNNDAPLANAEVKWTMVYPDGTRKTTSGRSDAQGDATTTLTSQQPGTVEITAELLDETGTVVVRKTTEVKFGSTVPDIDDITLTGAQSAYQWTDRSAKLALGVKNAKGDAIAGEQVTWDISNCADCTAPTETTTDANGKITATLTLTDQAAEGSRTIGVCSTTNATKCATTTITFLAPPAMSGYQTLGTQSAKTGDTFSEVRIRGGEIKLTATGSTNSVVSYGWDSSVQQIGLSGNDNLQRTITLKDDAGGPVVLTAKVDNLEERKAVFTVQNFTQWYYLPEGTAFYYVLISGATAVGCRTATAVSTASEMQEIYQTWGNFFAYTTELNRKDGNGNLPVWISDSQSGNAGEMFDFAGDFEGQHRTNMSINAGQAWAVCK
ncbi:MAG TPA: inverse autotransporter beta domain-containing protein [Buttiauxella sp.]|jgi:hypothetical protein